MSADDNKAAVKKLFASIDKEQLMSVAGQFLTPGYVVHVPGMPPMGFDGYTAFGQAFLAACPGITHQVVDPIAEGDRVAVRLHITGTHTQPLQMPNGAVPATGKELVIDAMNMFRFENGKVAEQWVSFDMLGVMQTLGVIPA